MSIAELANRMANLVDLACNPKLNPLLGDAPDLVALRDQMSDHYERHKSAGVDFRTASICAMAETFESMLDAEFGGSMTAAEWHKVADDRSAEIVHLMKLVADKDAEIRRLRTAGLKLAAEAAVLEADRDEGDKP